MEPFKKIYYPKKYRTGKLILFPFALIILLLPLSQMILSTDETLETKLIIGTLFLIIIFFLIFIFYLAINPVLAFSADSVYFYNHRILYGEIEKIQISKTKKLLLFALREKNSNSWLIDCKQVFFDPRILQYFTSDDHKWLSLHKQPNHIFLYNILGFDTPLEEILQCFPSNIPVIKDED